MNHTPYESAWDVVVIGGGPAGMMAAGRAAECGAHVLLLEKNASLGKKLLITGGGRCNVTNAEFDTKKLLTKYKEASKFLASPFSRWDARATIDFFESHGMPIKVEAEQRAFPLSNTAESVHATLLAYLRDTHVEVRTNTAVKAFNVSDEVIASVRLQNGRDVLARTWILAAGGISRPETGSNGDGFRMLRSLGHSVDESGGALVPLALKKSPTVRAAGVALTKAKVTCFQDGVKQASETGKILFTHVGLSGPAALNLSRVIGQLLIHGPVTLEVDFFPEEGYEKIDALLKERFAQDANKLVRNALGADLSPALVPVLLNVVAIDTEKQCNSVTRDERIRLMRALKHFPLEVDHLLGLEKAVVTSGGISLEELDWKTMQSSKYKNLFVVGDLLNIDRPSGGYSLQLCWTTGFVAGSAAAAFTRS